MTGITKADLAAISHDAWTADNIAAGGVCDFCLAVIDPDTVSMFTANGELTTPDRPGRLGGRACR